VHKLYDNDYVVKSFQENMLNITFFSYRILLNIEQSQKILLCYIMLYLIDVCQCIRYQKGTNIYIDIYIYKTVALKPHSLYSLKVVIVDKCGHRGLR